MYITKGDIQNFVGEDIDSTADSWLDSIIEMVGNYIDDYCDTTFADAGTATRNFDGSGNGDLVVDEFQSITSVYILDIDGNQLFDLLENVDFVTYPLNDSPKNRLQLLRGGQLISWPKQRYSVRITGSWGAAVVPGPIKMAALQLAARFLDKSLRGGMHIQRERLGEYDIIYEQVADDAKALGIFDILDGYRKIGMD
ncbi:MAG TPA: hypothetical protein VFX17_02140 [Patescibacteria group bacterium]|nr:hypothetical protein [Patescibacteria group bacterium]